MPQEIQDETICLAKSEAKAIIKQLYPACLFWEEGLENIKGKTVGFLEYKSSVRGEAVFNLMFIFELDYKVVLGSFSCDYEEHTEWRPIARQIMQSLRIEETEP